MTVEQRRRWRRYFGKTKLISMHGVTQRSQGSQCVFNLELQEDFFFVKFDSRTMETEHQLQFPMSIALTVVHMYQQVSQIWQTRGGRRTVTKANNRKHKTRTAKTLGVETFSVGKTKENKTQAKVSLAADNRSPRRRSAVFYRCSESYTAHCHRSEKIEISCSNSFCGLIFQVLRT